MWRCAQGLAATRRGGLCLVPVSRALRYCATGRAEAGVPGSSRVARPGGRPSRPGFGVALRACSGTFVSYASVLQKRNLGELVTLPDVVGRPVEEILVFDLIVDVDDFS